MVSSMVKLDSLSNEQRQMDIEAFRERQESLILRGKVIVIAIAIFIIVNGLVNLSTTFRLWAILVFLVEICLAVALIKGVPWVRYYLVAAMILGVVVIFSALGAIPMERGSYNLAQHSVSVTLTPSGEVTQTMLEAQPAQQPAEGFTFIYWVLTALVLIYLVMINLLIFSKSVKEYLYAVRYRS
jgi:hypothetical protein